MKRTRFLTSQTACGTIPVGKLLGLTTFSNDSDLLSPPLTSCVVRKNRKEATATIAGEKSHMSKFIWLNPSYIQYHSTDSSVYIRSHMYTYIIIHVTTFITATTQRGGTSGEITR